jgi:hypothetical protein
MKIESVLADVLIESTKSFVLGLLVPGIHILSGKQTILCFVFTFILV